MVETISYLTVTSVAYLVSALSRRPSLGFLIASFINLIWIGWFDFTAEVSPYALVVWYPLTTFLAALVGYVWSYLWYAPKMLSLGWLNSRYPGGGAWRMALITILYFLLLGLGHVIYELNVSGFPEPWGGVVLWIAIILFSLGYWLVIRRETQIFPSSDSSAQAFAFVFWLVIGYFVFAVAYVLVEFIASDNFFFVNQWNAWLTFILWGAIGIILMILGSAVMRPSEPKETVQAMQNFI
jgi:hypothetical protein